MRDAPVPQTRVAPSLRPMPTTLATTPVEGRLVCLARRVRSSFPPVTHVSVAYKIRAPGFDDVPSRHARVCHPSEKVGDIAPCDTLPPTTRPGFISLSTWDTSPAGKS